MIGTILLNSNNNWNELFPSLVHHEDGEGEKRGDGMESFLMCPGSNQTISIAIIHSLVTPFSLSQGIVV